MQQWLIDIVGSAIGALITAALLAFIRQRGVARRMAARREGKATSFEAFLRGNAPPFPRRWRYGRVTVTLGGPTWRPRFSLIRTSIPLPAQATVETIRSPAGFMEKLRTTPDCQIVVVRAGDVSLELAIVAADVPTALQALATGGAGSWSFGKRQTIGGTNSWGW